MAFINDIRGAEARTLSRLAGSVQSLAEAYEKRRRFRATMRELNALDFDTLEDLGFARGDIPDVAYRAVYGR